MRPSSNASNGWTIFFRKSITGTGLESNCLRKQLERVSVDGHKSYLMSAENRIGSGSSPINLCIVVSSCALPGGPMIREKKSLILAAVVAIVWAGLAPFEESLAAESDSVWKQIGPCFSPPVEF